MSRTGPPDYAQELETATLMRGFVPVCPLGAIVRVLSSRAAPAAYRLKSGTCVIGSASSCNIVVSDATVSRNHVELSLVPEGVAVCDMGSRNGTFYLGHRVERMVLSLGARISIGATEVAIDADTEALQSEAIFAGDTFRGMVGRSVALRKLFATVARLDGSLVPVLIGGESGAGKELIARAIHEGSRVSDNPFVVVNCGAIPHDLVASELFGHKKGAYTGAIQSRRGAFETADGGTLFLDEIGELPLDVQPMLLRALEAGEVRPVGGDDVKQVRVRVLAATNRNLAQEVTAGLFREDLFYRLAVVQLRVPPLRERPEDIEPLARRFASAAGLDDLSPSVIEQLVARPWPGNARELRNVIQAFTALGTLPELGGPKVDMIEMAIQQRVDLSRPYGDQKDEVCEVFTRIYLRELMVHVNGNQTAAARLAGLDRTYLGRLLVKNKLVR